MREIRKLTEDDFKESLELSQYAFQYKVEEENLPKRKESFKKHEVWYLEEEARRGLWNFICQHDSMVDKVERISSF
jgi:predicted acetyltransferase